MQGTESDIFARAGAYLGFPVPKALSRGKLWPLRRLKVAVIVDGGAGRVQEPVGRLGLERPDPSGSVRAHPPSSADSQSCRHLTLP
jgi:hypothetical protein